MCNMDRVYVFVAEASYDCNPDIVVYKDVEDAKARVYNMLEEYTGENYKILPEEKKRAAKEFKDNEGMEFSIKLSDDEVLVFYVEEKDVY